MNELAARILEGVRSVTTDLHYRFGEPAMPDGEWHLYFDRKGAADEWFGVSVVVSQRPGNGPSIGITKMPPDDDQVDSYVSTVPEAVRVILEMLEVEPRKSLAGKPVTLADVEAELGPSSSWGEAAKRVAEHLARPRPRTELVRASVLKALSEAIDKAQTDLDRLHRKGSHSPSFDGPSILEAAEDAFTECGFPK